MQPQPIKTQYYLNQDEISKHLSNVEFIIMATPSPEHFKEAPIHFTIFLNTADEIPKDIEMAILEKFRQENKISEPVELMSQLMRVGFAQNSSQDTLMPMLLVKPQDQRSIPSTIMHVFDFLADSDMFDEVKTKSLTGWSYSYTK